MTNKNDKEISKNPFSIMEEEVLEFWNKADTFKKSVEKEAVNGDYVFYDGPPFITGLPHYATLLPSIAKDVVPRFWTMKGYRVERVWGWDCHGLPAENQVEKELGLKNKNDIEKLGIGKFINACRNYVDSGSEQWEWYINRIARWVDMKNAYKTMDLKFMESVIWAFKELYEKDLIFEGHRSSLHCPRCATPLSKFEITMDAGSYRDVSEVSVVVKFKIKNKDNTYILAWTTTPWTLPGNLALAVGKKLKYVAIKIAGDDGTYILNSERAEEILSGKDYKIVKELKGKELIGLEYEPLFGLNNKVITENQNAFKVYEADFVSTEDGTGIVHIAPNFGEDDFNLGKANNLPLVDLMNESGIYTDEAGEWAGIYFKKANKKALDDLGKSLFSSFEYTHSYPFCYRCKTPLIYKTQKAWYLRIDEIRKEMIKLNKDINWVPEYFKEGRFKYNLENAPDWCLSRSRYWGSPLPVWKCTGDNCNEIKVIGSVKEIEELSGKTINDLHRPEIDEVEFSCANCGGKMRRVKEVLDCWFESGSMTFAQFHYPFERKDEFKNIFPADFIIEYTGQLRGWFYYLHVLASALFDDVAFKNVIVSGVLAGTDGRKMSKSYGNYPDPKNTLHKFGADALRMYFMNSSIMIGNDSSLEEKGIQDALRKNVMLFWNVAKFYTMFAGDTSPRLSSLQSGGQASKEERVNCKPNSENILDRWVLARLNQLIQTVEDNIEKYDLPEASRPLQLFINDLSTWYLRRSRDRFKGEDEKDKQAVLRTMNYVLVQASKVIAPFMPFISEQVWQKVNGYNFEDEKKSVHLEEWPEADKIDEKIINEMNEIRKIVELALAKRDEKGIKVRQPLNQFSIFNFQFSSEEYMELVKDEVNVKNIETIAGKGELKIELDTEITPKLRQEGIKRELVRFVNGLRKKSGLTINDRVEIFFKSENREIEEVIKKYREDLLKDTLADSMEIVKGKDIEGSKKIKINNEEIILAIKKK